MLETLSKKDKLWRQMAFSLCKNKQEADDLVQDMYLKLSEVKKEITDYYVFLTIKHLFFNSRRTLSDISIDDVLHLDVSEDDGVTEMRIWMNNQLDRLPMFKMEILLITHEKSLRECEEELGISYGVLNYHKNKILPELIKICKNGKKDI